MGDRRRPVVVILTVLYSIEVIGILWAAVVVANLGAGLPALSLVAAAALVGWHAVALLRLHARRLSVQGLAIQSVVLIAAIALATQRPWAGAAGIVVAAGVRSWARRPHRRVPRSAH
ncbi:hypothetical protein H7H82_15080, partial [Mycobacterium heidelbergense]|uniref:hypothetical protein n=1 Tax=Mycobacterium heidelbergense TaxID=53376 RepID=UPI0021F35791